MQSLNLEKIQNVDVKDTKTLTIIIIFIMVCFACVYVWQTKNNSKEGFASYSVNSGETVTLSGLDNVIVGVGTSNPISLTKAINNLIDARIAITSQGSVSRTTSPITPISQSNILSLVGVINGLFIKGSVTTYASQHFGVNIINDKKDFILGLNSVGEKIIEDRNKFKLPNSSSVSSWTLGDSFICLFDWLNDSNIFYLNGINGINDKNIIYTNVYPESTDSTVKLISPFNSATFKKGATYLFNVYNSKYYGNHNALFYVIYNKRPDGTGISRIIKLVGIHVMSEQNSHKYNYKSFVVPTTSDTVNIGIYYLSYNGQGFFLNTESPLSVTVYEVLNPTAPPAITAAPTRA